MRKLWHTAGSNSTAGQMHKRQQRQHTRFKCHSVSPRGVMAQPPDCGTAISRGALHLAACIQSLKV
jgi:hypothetical protein